MSRKEAFLLDGYRGEFCFDGACFKSNLKVERPIYPLSKLGMVLKKGKGTVENRGKKIQADKVAAQDKDKNKQKDEKAGLGLVGRPLEPFTKNRRQNHLSHENEIG